MLRQIQGWSQQDVAEKMRAYGYRWSQSTVTRLEAATRPIRLNELADLAALFGIPVTYFLELWTPEFGMDDLGALQEEIKALENERNILQVELHMARDAYDAAEMHAHRAVADMARVDGRLRALNKWQTQLTQRAEGPAEGGDGE
jgi:transcriptional regulator with XRE-family HTH domain